MLAHRSGLIGFPLRLLAREIYDRIVAAARRRRGRADHRRGAHPAADARATSSPPSRRCRRTSSVSFLAVDEIQLCADPERGHVFTDRLLHARGRDETMFLGADTIRPLLRQLVPEAEVITRPRFSTLTYTAARQGHAAAAAQRRGRVHRAGGLRARRAGAPPARRRRRGARRAQPAHAQRPGRALPGRRGRLPDRDRRDRHGPQHGPRPRRARQPEQVRRPRAAAAARARDRPDRRPRRPPHAGRHLRHHATTSAGSTPGPIEAVEGHDFPALRQLRWRSAALDLGSLDGLLDSLDAPPPAPCLLRTGNALDHVSLKVLARRAGGARARRRRPAGVRLLWAVCQIPDFRKTLTEAHLHLLGHGVRPPRRRAAGCRPTGSPTRSRGSSAPTATSTR